MRIDRRTWENLHASGAPTHEIRYGLGSRKDRKHREVDFETARVGIEKETGPHGEAVPAVCRDNRRKKQQTRAVLCRHDLAYFRKPRSYPRMSSCGE